MIESGQAEQPMKTMIANDHQSASRTMLANRRTFLAYIRTAVAIFLAGLTIIKLFDMGLWDEAAGYFLLMVGLLIFAFGLRQYRRMQKLVKQHVVQEIIIEKEEGA